MHGGSMNERDKCLKIGFNSMYENEKFRTLTGDAVGKKAPAKKERPWHGNMLHFVPTEPDPDPLSLARLK